jgi:hypothetical protein
MIYLKAFSAAGDNAARARRLFDTCQESASIINRSVLLSFFVTFSLSFIILEYLILHDYSVIIRLFWGRPSFTTTSTH